MTFEGQAEEIPHDLAPPDPSALLESLRAFGYSLRTAIADLIDNSIAAKAQNVWITFNWSGSNSFICIKDDGQGMSEESLIAAMRPGSQSPLIQRSEKDLGRFGLGLKTASFSQCRKLTVFSKASGELVVSRCWDLDYVNYSREWRLIKDIKPDILLEINKSDLEKGTIVLWQKMDRIVGNSHASDDKACKHFLEEIDVVKQHLEMVFHRYLERQNFKIWINGRSIKAWDPYLRNEKATQELPTEKLIYNGHEITVTPFILPHQSKISPELEYRSAGPNGWNNQQGFYVYRNERLLVGGDWLSLGFQKEEHFKLARIQLDLPNSMDNEWELDIKKSRAKPPSTLKTDLRKIATLTRDRALDIYRHRGKILTRQNAQEHVFLWHQKVRHGKFFYSINREHPLVVQVFKSAEKNDFKSLLNLLEESIPLAHILVTNAADPERFSSPYENEPPEIIYDVLKSSFDALLNTGLKKEEAKSKLLSMDPFNLFPEVLNQFLDNIEAEAE